MPVALKKILILSYYFPPCDLAASQRAYSWYSNLHKHGYYPVIVTRKWERPIVDYRDIHYPTSKDIEIEKSAHGEIHRLPFVPGWRDSLMISKRQSTLKGALRRFLTLGHELLERYSSSIVPFNNLYQHARSLLRSDDDFYTIIVTVNPFILLKFGHQLSKEFNIPWLADYRDDWTTSDWKGDKNPTEEVFNALNRSSEKKWSSSASAISTVSEHYANKLSNFTGRPAHVIYNGFNESELQPSQPTSKPSDKFTIFYNGSLYERQNIFEFLAVYKRVVDKIGSRYKFNLLFQGLNYLPAQSQKVNSAMQGYEAFCETSERIDRESLLKLQNSCQLLLLIGYRGIKGMISTKVFEYLASGKRILFYSSENREISDILTDTGTGLICQNDDELEQTLIELITLYFEDPSKYNEFQGSNLTQYTRENRTTQLARVLDGLQ